MSTARCVQPKVGACRIVHEEFVDAAFRCHQPHCGCFHCSLVSPVGCVWKFPHLLTCQCQVSGTPPELTLVRLGRVFNPLQVIAMRIFIVLFLRLEVKRSVMWLVMVSQWSLIGAIAFAGPATARTDRHGPFCEHSYRMRFTLFNTI